MSGSERHGSKRPIVPPPQQNLQIAISRASDVVRSQSVEQLLWLGARQGRGVWSVPVLEDALTVEPATGAVCTSEGQAVSPSWQVLTLHYLGVSGRPREMPPVLTFADIRGAQAYAPVYQQRVVGRLCGTVGRSARNLRDAAAEVAGEPMDSQCASLCLDFQVYPRVRLRLLWYAGDDELAPSASLLLPGNIESYFCLEDVVVLSERLVSRLSGKPF